MTAQTQTAGHKAETVEDVIEQIEAGRKGYTGVVTGEPFADEHGTRWHQVWEYENGKLTDAYVSRHGQQI